MGSEQLRDASVVRRNSFSRRYARIPDNYRSLDHVTQALIQSGLESSNLIIGIDGNRVCIGCIDGNPFTIQSNNGAPTLGRGHRGIVPLPPPSRNLRSTSFSQNHPISYPPSPTSTSSLPNERRCPVCFYARRNCALGCGHQTCCECGEEISCCPIDFN